MNNSIRKILRSPLLDKRSQELFSQFAAVFVKRINAETFNVDLDEVSVDFSAEAPLVKVNRELKEIVFASRALDSIPKNLRRYLVIHHLAHFVEPVHNEKFWSLLEVHQPNWHIMERRLERCFFDDTSAPLETMDFAPPSSVDDLSIAQHCQHILEESETKLDIGVNTKNGALVGAAV